MDTRGEGGINCRAGVAKGKSWNMRCGKDGGGRFVLLVPTVGVRDRGLTDGELKMKSCHFRSFPIVSDRSLTVGKYRIRLSDSITWV